jgi:hypothetical protein
MKAKDDLEQADLFATVTAASVEALAARGVSVNQTARGLELDLRSLGAVEVLGTEDGAYFHFAGPHGALRVILAPAAFFILRETLGRKL